MRPFAHAIDVIVSGLADGAEQIGALVALVGGLARPRSPLGALTDEAVLLTDVRFILDPDFAISR
jgi:LytS/YehU family sensor histidine kinase